MTLQVEQERKSVESARESISDLRIDAEDEVEREKPKATAVATGQVRKRSPPLLHQTSVSWHEICVRLTVCIRSVRDISFGPYVIGLRTLRRCTRCDELPQALSPEHTQASLYCILHHASEESAEGW